MAYGDKVINVTAEQLEYAVKNFDKKADKDYVDNNLVKFGESQDLTEEQKETARNNVFAQRRFEVEEDSALEFVDSFDENGEPIPNAPKILRIDNSGDVFSDKYGLHIKHDETITTDEYGNLKVNPDVVISPEQYADDINNIINILNEDREQISGNSEKLEQNTNDIENLRGLVSENTDSISNNKKAIEKNASDVAQNFANAVKGTGTGTAMALNDVSPISHKVQISGEAGDTVYIRGKNLLPQTNYKLESGSGITATHNADGTITLNGTTTGNMFISLVGNRTNNSGNNPFYGFPVGVRLIGLNFPASGTISGGNVYLYYRTLSTESAKTLAYSGKIYTYGLTINETISSTKKIFGIYLNCGAGVTFDNAVIAPMLYYGESDNKYEPYKNAVDVALDENGNAEIDSVQNMRIYSSDDIVVTYNRDLIKVLETYVDKNPLYGKKITFNGDSICANKGGFGKIIANNNNMTYENKAVSGGTVAYGTVSGSSNRHWICDTVSKMSDDADYILFEGGINDYWNNVPLGAITDTMSAEIDNTTFYGALESICRQALAKWIGKKIGFVIVHKINNTWRVSNANGNTFSEFHQAILEVCRKYSIPVCDIYETSTFNTELTEYLPYTTDDYGTGTGAGVHPTTEGYKLFYVDKITNFLKSL